MNKIILIALAMVALSCVTATPRSIIRDSMKVSAGLDNTEMLSTTYKELFDSFMDGTNIENFVKNSTACVHNTESGYEDMSEAIGHFAYRGWTWENYLGLNEALGDFTPIIRVCYDVSIDSVHDVRDHFGQFDDFVDFAKQAKDNFVVHLFDWYDVYDKINTAMKAGRSKDIAFQVGRAITLFLNFTPQMRAQVHEATPVELPDLKPYQDFLEGFLNGTKVLSSDKIKNCVNETKFMVQSVTDANTQFGKKTDEGYREGVFELADMFEHLKPLNQECYEGVVDVEDIIKKYIKTFKSPLDIVFNALKHFNDLYKDGISFLQHFKNSEWKEAGKDAGDVFYNVFFDH